MVSTNCFTLAERYVAEINRNGEIPQGCPYLVTMVHIPRSPG
jgi:hypothetical protein